MKAYAMWPHGQSVKTCNFASQPASQPATDMTLNEVDFPNDSPYVATGRRPIDEFIPGLPEHIPTPSIPGCPSWRLFLPLHLRILHKLLLCWRQ